MVKKKDPGANRAHRERGQTTSRGRMGLLEKHKDYVLRARDYKSKQARLQKLREKAAFRNKDEFYWGMVKGKTKDGVAIGDRGNEALGPDVVKMLKTQDARYVRLQIAKDQKKVDKLRRELESLLPPSDPEVEWDALRELKEVEALAEMGIVVVPRDEALARSGPSKKGKAPVKQHTIFADDRESFESTVKASTSRRRVTAMPIASSSTSAVGIPSSTETQDLGWDDIELPPSRATDLNAETAGLDSEDEEQSAQQLQNHRMYLYGALSAHLGRIRQLRIAETKLSTHIGLYGKGSARKVQKGGWVEDDNAPEDRNGDRKTLQRDVYKYKLPRRK